MATIKMTAPVDVAMNADSHRLGDVGKDSQAASATKSNRHNPTVDFDSDIKVSKELPTIVDLKNVADLPMLDADGKSQPFKNIYSGEKGARRVLVIFVRHFFCGNCQEFLRTLSSSVTPEALLTLPTSTQIAVIGCGHPDLISPYRQTTTCPFPIYTDPTRKLYDLLGMTRTLDLGSKSPEYMQKSLLSVMLASLCQSLKSGRGATKGGDYRQVGGEFLFEDGNVTWGRRMKNTRDHAEIPELRKVLGLDGERPPMRETWTTSVGKALSHRRQNWSRSRSRTRPGKESFNGSVMEKAMEGKGAKTNGNGIVVGDTPLMTVESQGVPNGDTNGSVASTADVQVPT